MKNSKYDPSNIESKWYKQWEEGKTFSPKGEGEPYCIMIPPPNVTGTLHMGHAFQITLMDTLCRYHRMLGYNTLWQAGTDHAGIATQMVVERKLTAQGISRTDLGREKFIDQVWGWKNQSGDIITKQLRRMGASLDWDSERFTLDEGLSKSVKKVFIDLYDKGLIYRGKRIVNWDPVLQTALSDLEVISSEETGKLWKIKYQLENNPNEYLEIATTRPETILGDTAVAVNPEDERYKKYIGQKVIVPIIGRSVKIIGDDHVDMEFGTGCLKITPAHDFNDYKLGEKHNLEFINIFDSLARINSSFPKYKNLDRYEARKKILNDLKNENLLLSEDPHKMVVPRGDRSHAVIEPYITDQWYVKVEPLASKAIEYVKDNKIKFIPKNWEKTYFEWMNNIEDWCISRQLWWGHRIPAWYDANNNIYVGNSEKEVREKYEINNDIALTQDEDVLDTWFSSSLWPFSTLGWPDETERVKTFYPTSTLITGFDIIFFWVARMIMMGLEFLNDVPFKEIYVHGLVRDASGNKMSKSKGNIIDPIDLIDGITLDKLIEKRSSDLMQPEMEEKIIKNTKKEYPNGIGSYGTDALRFTFASLAGAGRDINFDLKRVEGYRNFCNKLWNAARFIEMQKQEEIKNSEDPVFTDIDKWIYKRLDNSIEETKKNYAIYRFDYAARNLYEFVWNDFCNWYIEISKVRLLSVNISEKEKSSIVFHLKKIFYQIILMLHPIMPFITEEIHKDMFNNDNFIQNLEYPKKNNISFKNDGKINWMIALISEIRKLRSESNVPPSEIIDIYVTGETKKDKDYYSELSLFINTLTKADNYIWSDKNDLTNISTCIINNLKIQIDTEKFIDIKQEIIRLEKEIEKASVQASQIKTRISNSEFIENAPGHVVVKDRQKLEELNLKIEKLETQRKSIKQS